MTRRQKEQIRKLKALEADLRGFYFAIAHQYPIGATIPAKVSKEMNCWMFHAENVRQLIIEKTGAKPKVKPSSNVKNASSFIRMVKEGKI